MKRILLLGLIFIGMTGLVSGQTANDVRAKIKAGCTDSLTTSSVHSEINEATKEDTLSKAALINGQLYNALVSEGDTVPMVSLGMVSVKRKRVFKSKRERRKYLRLERHVRKVYPFAKLANEKLVRYEKTLKGLSDKRRKKFMRVAEKEIRKEFSNDLKALTFNQGRILLKLIDRETGNVSYDLVKDLRGGFTAWLFQGVARVFDFNLKSEYDPENDDRLIEEILVKIEQEQAVEHTVSR